MYLCLLVGAFNPFTFKVIIYMYVPIIIFLIVMGLACLVVLNSLSFCLSVKVLISPSNLNEIFAGNIGCRFFPFITLNISCHCFLAFRVSAEKSAINLMGVPVYVICHFSLVAFINFSLYLIFVNLIAMCLHVFLLGFLLPGTLCASWTWVTISSPMLGKFLTIISSNIFSGPFSLSSPSGTPIMRMLCLMLSQESLRLSSFLFILFSLFCSAAVNSTILSSRSLIHSSASVILLLIPSSVFSFQLLFCSPVCLFFNSSRCLFFNSSSSLLNISCIFSLFASILFPKSWIIFTTIILIFLDSCLSPLHLVVFRGFYFVPSSGT
uniref:Uncharacterized protein n=1 Tax=Monodon monoceros TaxID=40151 RepID=A0A8C6BAV5_MONMO